MAASPRCIFYILFAGLDDILLSVMAYDRFVAICHPLCYSVIMNPRLWIAGSDILDTVCCVFLVTYLNGVVTVLLPRFGNPPLFL